MFGDQLAGDYPNSIAVTATEGSNTRKKKPSVKRMLCEISFEA